AHGRRLGRQLYAGAQGVERPDRGSAAVPSRCRARGGGRRERGALVWHRRRRQRLARLAMGIGSGRAGRRARIRAGAGRPAGPTPSGGPRSARRTAGLPTGPSQPVGARLFDRVLCAHVEMSALRGWVVTFLTFVAAQTSSAWTPLAPATVASVMGLVG